MFCKHCGKEIADHTAFCPECGGSQQDTAVAVAPGGVPVMTTTQQEREMLLTQMNNSFEVMTAMKQVEDEIDKMEQDLPDAQKGASTLTMIILVAVGILFTIYIIGAFVIVWAVSRQRKSKKRLDEINQNLPVKRNELETLKNDAALAWLPYDYRDSTSFAMMYNYVNNMRANTLSEALNLLETERHQARVELLSTISAQASMSAARSADNAAGAAAASAFFSLFK